MNQTGDVMAGSSRSRMWDVRPSVRDPLAGRLIGPGKPFEIEETMIAGFKQQIFAGQPRNLAGLYRRAIGYGTRDLVVRGDVAMRYDAVFARAASLARVLRSRYGLTRGTVVALAAGNSAEFLIGLIAITAAGGIAALINSRGVGEEMLRAIATGGCTIAILDAERADILAATEPDRGWPHIVAGVPAAPLRAQDMSFEEATGDTTATFDPVEMEPADGAVILFTSGTTGFPKAALLSHGALAHAIAISSFVGALQDLRYEAEHDTILAADQKAMTSPAVILPPMFHLSGMMPALRALSVGATIHLMSKWNVDIAFDTMARTGMSRLSFVPAMLWDIFRSPRATPQVLAQIRYMVNGGAPLNPDIVEEIGRRMPNVLLCNTYGQSENTSWATTIAGQAYLDHPESCGWAVPTICVAIRRDDLSEADIGERGEIWTASASTMTEYFGDPEATAEALVEGWLATGDIGYICAEGLVHVVDRKKNMVISGGENIYCAEVERVLSQHPAVLECLAYGLPDARLGERLVADIYADPAAGIDADAIKAHCRRHLAIYKVPREVHFRDGPLPRTASGKIERRRAPPPA